MALIKSLISILALVAIAFGMAIGDFNTAIDLNDTARFDGWVAPPCDKVACCVKQDHGRCALGLYLSWKDEPMYAYVWDFNCKVIGFHDKLVFKKTTSVASELPGYVVVTPEWEFPSFFKYLGKEYQNGWSDQGVDKNHDTWYDRHHFDC